MLNLDKILDEIYLEAEFKANSVAGTNINISNLDESQKMFVINAFTKFLDKCQKGYMECNIMLEHNAPVVLEQPVEQPVEEVKPVVKKTKK